MRVAGVEHFDVWTARPRKGREDVGGTNAILEVVWATVCAVKWVAEERGCEMMTRMASSRCRDGLFSVAGK